MLHADTPAPFHVEFRGAGGTSETGPSLRFQADGRILAGGNQVLQAPSGTWTHVEIAFRLGDDAPAKQIIDMYLDGFRETPLVTMSDDAEALAYTLFRGTGLPFHLQHDFVRRDDSIVHSQLDVKHDLVDSFALCLVVQMVVECWCSKIHSFRTRHRCWDVGR